MKSTVLNLIRLTQSEAAIPITHEDDWYGVEWDSTAYSPDCTRIGKAQLHRDLPVQNGMVGGTLTDAGVFTPFPVQSDWTNQANQARDGSAGQVMVKIPAHYEKFEKDGNTRRVKLSMYPLEGYIAIPMHYVSAYEASLDRANNKLCSVANMSDNYRGGDNTDFSSTYDPSIYTLNGRPVSSKSCEEYRTAARNRNSGDTQWNTMLYLTWKTLCWLFVVEYATRNSQKAINNTLTEDGYKQGGLGSGYTTADSTGYKNFNNEQVIVPCGYLDTLGNGTGEIYYDLTNAGYSNVSSYANKYRGIEHPFGHIWKFMDGVLIDGSKYLYFQENPANFGSSTSNYTASGLRMSSSIWAKDVHLTDGNPFNVYNSGSGTEARWFCDYQVGSEGGTYPYIRYGGSINKGTQSGLFATNSHKANTSFKYISTRLCYLPN